MAFSEVREYQPGDDVRSIDWNVTARYNNPFVKVFEEEREMTVILLIDLSGSSDFGTQNQLKREVVTEISAYFLFLQYTIMIKLVLSSFLIRLKNLYLQKRKISYFKNY